jgi:pilus assembly protein CpaE
VSLVTVMTASGGSGGTTIAINLADELRRASGEAVLVVDMDLDYGAAAAYLGLDAGSGLADALAAETIDAASLRASTSVFFDDLHVLTSPSSVDYSDPPMVRFDRLDALLAACGEAYGHTVVDAPRASRDVAATLARASELTLVVFQLTVMDVRCVRAVLRSLDDRGVPRDRVLPVANRCGQRPHMLTLADAQDALGGLRVASVGNDFESALRSLNLGRPLAAVAPSSVVRRDLHQLAARVGGLT